MPEPAEEAAPVDLLVTDARVVTMDPERRIVDRGAVAVDAGVIREVGGSADLAARYRARRVLDAGGGLVTPGFVNAHQHVTGGSLTWSCIPDNLVPGSSIFEWSIPLHSAETAADEALSATVTAVESLRAGTTTVIEPGTMSHAAEVADALQAAGIRAGIGVWGWDVEGGPLAGPAPEVLDRLAGVLDAHPPGGLVEGWVTLVGHSLASDELLAGAAALAVERGASMTMHLSPTSSDPEVYLERHGRRPAVHLEALGVLGRHLLLGHAVWLDDAEIEAVLRTGTAIAYCPWAYLRLGQGVTHQGRHAEIVRRGGRVALGCDAVNAGDTVDVLRTAALAAGLAKDQRTDPTWFGAHEALEMATIGGAEAVGMADRIGSIEAGKQADLVVFETTRAHWASPADPALALVWATDGRHVRHVVVDGRLVVEDGHCRTVDESELRREAARVSVDLLQRAGITAPVQWPVDHRP